MLLHRAAVSSVCISKAHYCTNLGEGLLTKLQPIPQYPHLQPVIQEHLYCYEASLEMEEHNKQVSCSILLELVRNLSRFCEL